MLELPRVLGVFSLFGCCKVWLGYVGFLTVVAQGRVVKVLRGCRRFRVSRVCLGCWGC